MKSTYIIIILSLIIIGGGYYIYTNKNVENDYKTLEAENRRYKDSVMTLFNQNQKSYEATERENDRLEAELLTQKAVVKTKEDKLTKTEASLKIALTQKKKELALLSEAKADSIIKYRYRNDPDSVNQKVLYDLARLEYSDSLILALDQTLQSYQKEIRQSDAVISSLTSLNDVSRQQISLLLLSQSKDIELLGIKDKEIKKQKRLKWLGYSVAVLVTALFVSN